MSHNLPGQFPGMVAFSRTLFGLAHHMICTYYTMILGLAPYDFFAEGETQKAHSPALSVGGVGPAKSAIPSAIVPGGWSTSAKFGRRAEGRPGRQWPGCMTVLIFAPRNTVRL